MKTLMKMLFVLAICIVVVGFYRGWFSLSSSGRDVDSNKVNVSLTVDPDKMKEDAGKVEDKAAGLTD
jgi:cell division protein FtsX